MEINGGVLAILTTIGIFGGSALLIVVARRVLEKLWFLGKRFYRFLIESNEEEELTDEEYNLKALRESEERGNS